MRYGSVEFTYAAPFANELALNAAFCSWVLQRTKFASDGNDARLLHEEMRTRRSGSSENWWRSHYTEKCRCEGCSGQETDLLAIFEAADAKRFALHVEVKQPTDRFSTKRDQAGNYALRAKCWATRAPAAVVPHSDAATVLLCSALKLDEYAPHAAKFGTVITFEGVAEAFPSVNFGSSPH
jgi:hypothetical protein